MVKRQRWLYCFSSQVGEGANDLFNLSLGDSGGHPMVINPKDQNPSIGLVGHGH